jgi:hypothetical protein
MSERTDRTYAVWKVEGRVRSSSVKRWDETEGLVLADTVEEALAQAPGALWHGWGSGQPGMVEIKLVQRLSLRVWRPVPLNGNRHSEQQGDTAHNPADTAPISRTAE